VTDARDDLQEDAMGNAEMIFRKMPWEMLRALHVFHGVCQ
jgi:hypothetical protein